MTLEAFARSPVDAATDLPGCFAMFKLMHLHISTLERVERVTREALEDFARDNVVYLELR